MYCLSVKKNSLPSLRLKNPVPQLDQGPGIEGHPQLIAPMMVLQGESTAQLYSCYLDSREHLVRVLLKHPPRFFYLYGRWDMAQSLHSFPQTLSTLVPRDFPRKARLLLVNESHS